MSPHRRGAKRRPDWDALACRLTGMDPLSPRHRSGFAARRGPWALALAGIAFGTALTVAGLSAGPRAAGIVPLPAVAGAELTLPPAATARIADDVIGVGVTVNGAEALVDVPQVENGAAVRIAVGVHNLGLGELRSLTVTDVVSGVQLQCTPADVLADAAAVCVTDGSVALLPVGVWQNEYRIDAVARDGTARTGTVTARYLVREYAPPTTTAPVSDPGADPAAGPVADPSADPGAAPVGPVSDPATPPTTGPETGTEPTPVTTP